MTNSIKTEAQDGATTRSPVASMELGLPVAVYRWAMICALIGCLAGCGQDGADRQAIEDDIAAVRAQRDAISSPYSLETQQDREAAAEQLTGITLRITALRARLVAIAEEEGALGSGVIVERNASGRRVQRLDVDVRRKRLRLRQERLAAEEELNILETELPQLQEIDGLRQAYLAEVARLDLRLAELQAALDAYN